MAMRKSVRRELRMLRGVVRSLLENVRCHFCREQLLDTDNFYQHGNCEGSPIETPVTEHHLNGNHKDNRKSNRVWCHRRCHKAYHLWLRHKEQGKQVRPWAKIVRKLKAVA